MSIVPLLIPPSSFQISLRAVSRSSGKLLSTSAARQFSTKQLALELCFNRSTRGSSSPSRILEDRRSRNLLPYTTVRTIFRFRAITHYTNLPESYQDAEGLPFRKEDLNQRDVNTIFGAHLTARQANHLVKVIHGRRVAGTLEDPGVQHNTAEFSAEDKTRALDYLRTFVPVDEVINAGLRAEDELQALEAREEQGEEASQQFDETNTGDPSSKPQEEGPKTTQQKSDSPYGVSNFDRGRAENIAKREAKDRQLEQERIKREEEEAKGNIGTLRTQQQTPRQLSPRMQQWMQRGTSDLKEIPKMKSWERLLPSFAMTVLICAGCAVFAYTYKPPNKSGRLWPDIPPAAATCLTLIALNLCVWQFWKTPPLWSIMNRYFIVVAATPRPLQLLGAMFSHQTFGHLAVNMVTLWFFGTRVHDEVGRGNFLAIYLASGTAGFAASLANLVLRRGLTFTTLGASGGIWGIVVAFFWNHKYDEFKILGYPPDPLSGPQGLAFIGLVLGMHIVGLFAKRYHNTDIASHVGGMLAGGVGMELVRKHMNSKARMRAEKLKTMGVLQKTVEKKRGEPPARPSLDLLPPIRR